MNIRLGADNDNPNPLARFQYFSFWDQMFQEHKARKRCLRFGSILGIIGLISVIGMVSQF